MWIEYSYSKVLYPSIYTDVLRLILSFPRHLFSSSRPDTLFSNSFMYACL